MLQAYSTKLQQQARGCHRRTASSAHAVLRQPPLQPPAGPRRVRPPHTQQQPRISSSSCLQRCRSLPDDQSGAEGSSSSSAAPAAAEEGKEGAADDEAFIVFTAEQLQQDAPAAAAASPAGEPSAPAAAAAAQPASTADAAGGDEDNGKAAAAHVPPLPTHLTVSCGPADDGGDDAAAAADFGGPDGRQQQQSGWSDGQQQPHAPPLIDPSVDIANDPAYAIRLMDILDQVVLTPPGSSSGSRAGSPAPGAAAVVVSAGGAGDGPGSQQQQAALRLPNFVRQPAAFCANCCTPLDPLRPAAACSTCGHFAADDALLFSQGLSSRTDAAAHSPPWLLQQQRQRQQEQRQAQQQAQQQQQQQQQSDSSSDAGGGNSSSSSSGSTLTSSNWQQQTQQQRQQSQQQPDHSPELAGQRAEAAALLHQAQQQLQDAGVLRLPRTLLAWEEEGEGAPEEPCMHLHRGLLPPNHERPERLSVIEARLRSAGLMECCVRLPPREASDEELLAVHSPGLLGAVAALSNANAPSDLNRVAEHLAPDMLGNRFTNRAARCAAGTAAELAVSLVTGAADSGVALIRPMGHTAGADTTEGGSYLNNAAVAARAAQRAGARRVLIVDWDVHHCRGTSSIFAEDPSVLVFSLHRYGSSYFPGTGAASEVGVGRGRGRTINVAWSPPTVTDKSGRRIQVDAPPVSDGDYLTAWSLLLLPVAAEFRPDLILVSAGFSAVDKDPLGHSRLHPEAYGHLTALLRPLAPLGLLLEGGYNLAASAACVESCVRALLGERPAPLRGTRYAGVTGWSSVLRTLLVHQEFWQSLGLLNFLQLATQPLAGTEDEEDEEGEYEQGGYEEGGEEEDELPVAVAGGTSLLVGHTDDGAEGYEEEDEAAEEEDEEEEEDEGYDPGDWGLLDAAGAGAGDAEAEAGASSGSVAAAGPEEQQHQQQLDRVVAALQHDPQLLQQVTALLDSRGRQQQQHQQPKGADAGIAAAAAAAAAAADAQLQQASAGARGGRTSTKGAAAATTSSSSMPGSSSSSTAAPSSSSSWSAGGFLDEPDAVDSGSDDDEAAAPAWQSPLGSTDWACQQIDGDDADDRGGDGNGGSGDGAVLRFVPGYAVADVAQQLRQAESDIAAAAAKADERVDAAAGDASSRDGGQQQQQDAGGGRPEAA